MRSVPDAPQEWPIKPNSASVETRIDDAANYARLGRAALPNEPDEAAWTGGVGDLLAVEQKRRGG